MFKKNKKRDNDYQIKCINYFLDYDLVVFGNRVTFKRFVPITFRYIDCSDFMFQIDIDKWEELYIHRGIILKLIEKEYKEKKYE